MSKVSVRFTIAALAGGSPRPPMCMYTQVQQGALMMKRALIIAAGCALLAGPALAQSPPSGPDRDGDHMERRDLGWDRDWRGGWGWDDRDRDDQPRDLAEGWRGAWAGTTATAVARAFFSRAGIHASPCDVTKTSRCGPASMRPRRCWTGCVL